MTPPPDPKIPRDPVRIPITPPNIGTGPFSQTDGSTLDPKSTVRAAQALKEKMERVRTEIEEKLNLSDREPKAPAGTEPAPDGPGTRPPGGGSGKDGGTTDGKVTRADQLLPFLLIRSINGDYGARPAQLASSSSPDVLATFGRAADPIGRVKTRDEAIEFTTHPTPYYGGVLIASQTADVWIHVWNLGRAPAWGVRVRAWVIDSNGRHYIGGTSLDLPDRLDSNCHVIVKVASWTPVLPANVDETQVTVRATADSISDVAKPNAGPSADRHTAECSYEIVRHLNV
jgi:hypothetical protein